MTWVGHFPRNLSLQFAAVFIAVPKWWFQNSFASCWWDSSHPHTSLFFNITEKKTEILYNQISLSLLIAKRILHERSTECTGKHVSSWTSSAKCNKKKKKHMKEFDFSPICHVGRSRPCTFQQKLFKEKKTKKSSEKWINLVVVLFFFPLHYSGYDGTHRMSD